MTPKNPFLITLFILCLIPLADAQIDAPSVPHTAVASYDSIDRPDNVILTLKNTLSTPLTARVILRPDNASDIQSTATLQPRETRSNTLQELFPGALYSSAQVIISYDSPYAENLIASLSSASPDGNFTQAAQNVDDQPNAPDHQWTVLWYRPSQDAQTTVTLSNPTARQSAINFGGKQILLTPGQKQHASLVDTTSTPLIGATTFSAPARVSVETPNNAALAMAFLISAPSKTSAAQPVTLRSGPIRFDPEKAFGVVLHNTTTRPLSVIAVLKQFTAGQPNIKAQQSVSVPPSETVFMPLSSNKPEPLGWDLVDVSYTGTSNDLLAMVVGGIGKKMYAQRLSHSTSTMFVGSHWVLDQTAASVIRVSNPGKQPAKYRITLYSQPGALVYEFVTEGIAPGMDSLIDLGEIAPQITPDAKGRTLSASVTQGSYEITTESSNSPLFSASTSPERGLCAKPHSVLWTRGPSHFSGPLAHWSRIFDHVRRPSP